MGQGSSQSFPTAHFLRPTAEVERFHGIDDLRRFITHIFLNNPQL